MNDGRIVQVGSPTEIYNHPASEFASSFIGEANLLTGQVKAVEADHAEVDVSGLVLVAPLRPGLSVGQGAIVSLRPERASLFAREGDVPQTLTNVFPGQVESAIFLGPVARYHIRLNNGQVIVVDQATMGGVLSYHANDRLYVGWETTSNIILAA